MLLSLSSLHLSIKQMTLTGFCCRSVFAIPVRCFVYELLLDSVASVFEEWDSLIFLSHVFVVQFYHQGVSWLWEDPRQAGNRRCWAAGPPGAVRCDSDRVLISSLQLWNFVFFPENDSFPLCFPVMFILHYFQCPLVILWISAVSAARSFLCSWWCLFLLSLLSW